VAVIGDNGAVNGAHGDKPTPAASAHVLNGIRSLHDRIDELEQLVAGEARHELAELRELPAWRRRTAGEPRYQVALCTAAGIALQIAVPGRLVLLQPYWVLPAVQGLLLVVLFTANPHRINNQSHHLRWLALSLAALLTVANGWSVWALARGLVTGHEHWTPSELLITGAVIWLTNVVAFALWYWEFDRGGPVARALATKPYPDLLFPQMTFTEDQQLAPPHWEPTFVDYLYTAFTNASAFSPTDVLPLTRWAKLAMTAQTVISLVTVALVVSRAVNILA
jgi:hypothetical protein